MNQGKLEVVKQEMERVNIDMLGISELKRTGMSEFNSDDHYSNYCGKNPLEKWTRHHSQQKNQKCSILMRSQNDLCLFPREAIQYQSTQVYAPTSNAEEAEVEWFYEDLQDILELTPKKRCPFHYRELECKK